MGNDMDRDQFLVRMDELLELPSGSLKGPEQLEDLEGWDSLAVLSFIAMMDETYGVTVATKQIVACKTVDELAALAGSAASH